jgi:hypothetical protein
MRFITILLFALLMYGPSLAQSNFVIEGQVVNQETGDPIAYANVGIPGKYIGVATNQKGVFTLKLPAGTSSDTLQISTIGFTTKTLKVSVFNEQNNQTVSLQPKTYELNSITVSDTEDWETEWVGKKIKPVLSGAYGRSYSKKNIRATYAFKVQWDKSLPLRILHTRMYLKENHNDGRVKLRCRIMNVDSKTGLPDEDLMDYNITGSAKDRGWVTCDFLDKDIYIDESSFFVVFEWLRESSKVVEQPVAAMFGIGIFFDSEVYVRDHALGRWKKNPNDIIYSVKVEY